MGTAAAPHRHGWLDFRHRSGCYGVSRCCQDATLNLQHVRVASESKSGAVDGQRDRRPPARDQLARAAKRSERSVGAEIRLAIREHLERDDEEEGGTQ